MDIRPPSNLNAPAPFRLVAERPAAPAPAAAMQAEQIKTEDVPKQAGGTPGKDELAQALKSINNVLQDRSPGLEFSIDRESDRSVVKVVDKDTNEVIRQMPSREAIEIAKALDKLHSLMVRETA